MNKRIKFYLRVVPDERKSPECLEIDNDQKTIWFSNRQCPAISKLPFIKFETDGIFTDACQAFIYDTVLGSSVASSIHKIEDVIVLACGSNGTGKTYTMMGIRDHYHFRGIIPRLVESLFELRQKKDFTLRILALEFRNGTCYNLLSSPVQEVDCRKMTGERLTSETETFQLLFEVESRRKTAFGENCGSLVVTILVKPLQRSRANSIMQKIHLVDTAGSEVHWSKIRERPCMNRKTNGESSFLYDPSSDWAYLTQQAAKGRMKPQNFFRNCQMVGYLSHSLRYGSVRVIGHVRRGWEYGRYTQGTLKFGTQLTGRVEEPSSREVIGPSAMSINQSLETEVQRLRDELALTDLLENGIVPVTEPQPNASNLNADVKNFLKSQETEPYDHLLTLAHPFTLLRKCKTVYRRCLEEMKDEYDLDGGDEGTGAFPKPKIRPHSRAAKKKSMAAAIDEAMVSKLTESTLQSTNRSSDLKELTKDKMAPITQETLEIAKLNRQTYWKEFLSRHPYWHHRLTAAGEDLNSAREDRKAIEDQLDDLNKALRENKLEVERTNWERSKDVGNPVDSNGKIIMSADEQKALEEQEALYLQHKNLMKTFKQVQYHYIETAYKFNEAHEAANKLFTEYLNTTYWNVLTLPASEDYEETIPILGVDLSKKPTVTQSEEIFIQLQNKHLNRDKRDLPHPRWP